MILHLCFHPADTHWRTDRQRRTDTQTDQTETYRHVHKCSPTLTRARAHTHNAHSNTRIRTYNMEAACTHARARTHTPYGSMHTHARANTPPLSLSLSHIYIVGGEWGKQVGSMNEESQVRGCYNITFICTNQKTVSVLEKTQANKTFRTWKQM